MKNTTSQTFGRFKNMNLRFWGGWFLVLAGIAVMLTMGCEKGALGVKSALVTGRVVDKENLALGIPNATVKLVSKEMVGSGELAQGNNLMSTVTDAQGNFVFENVNPDNVVLEVQAAGYNKIQYPGEDTSIIEGEIPVEQFVESISVRSGSVTNVGNIAIYRLTNPLPETIVATLLLRDMKTLRAIEDAAGTFDISFNNQTFRNLTPSEIANREFTLSAESSYVINVKPNRTDLYTSAAETVNVSGNFHKEIMLEPLYYNLLLRCVNVPDYIEGGVVNVYAEAIDDDGIEPHKPPQVIATHSINNLGTLDNPNLPEVIQVSGLALPVELRVQVRGYKDEVMKIESRNLSAGTMGTYRIDIDFLADNGTDYVTYDDPFTAAKTVGLFDNMITRDIYFSIAGPHLVVADLVNVYINLPTNIGAATTPPPAWLPPLLVNNDKIFIDDANPSNYSATPLPSVNGGEMGVVFRNVAVGYNLNYTVSVTAGSPATMASGSYVINSIEPMMINPPVDNSGSGLVIGVFAKRPDN